MTPPRSTWLDLRAVDLDFIESAPRRWVMEAEIASPRAAVWDAVVDPTTWIRWFPGVHSACYRGDGPHGVGSIREATVGGHQYEEVVLCWEPRVRWAYAITRTTFAIAHAQVECTELEDTAKGTRLRWTLAADPRWRMRLSGPLLQRHLQSLFSQATKNLEGLLADGAG